MSGQISGQGKQPRVPVEVQGININRCTNPICPNFNIPAINSRNDPNYTIVGNKKRGSSIKCKSCSRHYTVKSNRAVAEEMERLRCKPQLAKVFSQDGYSCSNIDCDNFGIHATLPSDKYIGAGRTDKGNQRFKCRNCNKTFTRGSEKRRSHPQARTHDNDFLFRLLISKSSINRSMFMADMPAATVYKKIDMFYERSIHFLLQREERLKELELPMMRLSSDRQEYQVNWLKRHDKRNIVISSVGTADKVSGYVFGMDVNFDPYQNMESISESDAYKADLSLKDYNRTYSRLWTKQDYTAGIHATEDFYKKASELLDNVIGDISLPLSQAALANIREEVAKDYSLEAAEQSRFTSFEMKKGALVHSEYTLYAHFLKLRQLIGHAPILRFYLDQDPGINRACLLAFADRVQDESCHAAFIRYNKELTVHEKRKYMNAVSKYVKQLIKEGQAADEHHAHKIIVQRAMQETYSFSGSPEQWFSVPIHKINEPEKYVALLTDQSLLDMDNLTALLLDATLAPIDRFFNQVRSMLSLLARGFSSPSNAGRIWTGASPYNPVMVNKMLQIYRVYYNYCKVGQDTKTPAQRIGLAKGPVEIRKILYPN